MIYVARFTTSNLNTITTLNRAKKIWLSGKDGRYNNTLGKQYTLIYFK